MTDTLNAERAVLGAVILDDQHLTGLLLDEHLKAGHFAVDAHRAIFQTVVDLHDAGESIDSVTIHDRLRSGELDISLDEIEVLTAYVPTTGNARAYGRIVREQSHARDLIAAARRIDARVSAHAAPVPELLDEAERMVTGIADESQRASDDTSRTPAQLADWYVDQFDNQEPAWPYPTTLRDLNRRTNGGLRSGQLILIGGYEGMGKTVLVDSLLQHCANLGLSVHLYINEMTVSERLDRMVARNTGVHFGRIRSRNLRDGDYPKLIHAASEFNIGITDCAGWTATEIARHVRRNQWDITGVDILHNIQYEQPGEAGAADVAKQMRIVTSQTGTAMIAAIHLNQARAIGVQYPLPVNRDIRESGMFAKLADQVWMVHRDQDEDGIPQETGLISCTKIRDGQPGAIRVMFRPSSMSFEQVTDLQVVGTRADQYPGPDSRIESGAAGF